MNSYPYCISNHTSDYIFKLSQMDASLDQSLTLYPYDSQFFILPVPTSVKIVYLYYKRLHEENSIFI